jgi:hypothetical protein
MHVISVARLCTVQLIPCCSNHFFRMSTLREGHASLLCIVLIATGVIEVTIIGELGRGLLDG